MKDTGHELLDGSFEVVGFEHGGVAVGTARAKGDVEERTYHRCLREGDSIFDIGFVGAAILDTVGEGEREDKDEEEGSRK